MTPEQKASRLDRLRWRYHNDPAYRDRVLEQQRRYRQKASYKEKLLIRKRRWVATVDPEHLKRKRAQYHQAQMQKPHLRAAMVRRAKVAKLKSQGLTTAQYEAIVAEQGGICALCGDKPERLVVDHDHANGQFRGLICRGCNTGLGLFGDSIEGLRLAIAYLERRT